jgi:signal transduction histidine kinase
MSHSGVHVQPAAAADPSVPATLRWRGWLAVVRVGWIGIAVLTIVLFAASLPVEFAHFQQVCSGASCSGDDLTPDRIREIQAIGLSVPFFAWAFLIAEIVFVSCWCAIGAVIFWRKSTDCAALFVSFFLVTFSATVFLNSDIDNDLVTPAKWLSICIITLGWTCFFMFFYLFPDGRFVPMWTRPIPVVLIALIGGALAFPNMPVFQWFSPLRLVPNLCLILTGIAAQLYRYWRVSGPTQRQQTRLVVFGVTAALTVMAIAQVALLVFDVSSVFSILAAYIMTYLALLVIPLVIGIAILRYQLWEIRILVNHALVYGALTACVVAVYVLVVGTLSALVQTSANLLISLVATGLVAVIFQPLRARLQRHVNRLVYGVRDDPYAVLAQLNRRLEATLAPETVLPTIVETVAQALRLPYAAIALDQDGICTTAAAVGVPVSDTIRLTLSHGGEPIGLLILAPRAPGAPFSAADQRLLDDLIIQASATVHRVRLMADLQRMAANLQQSREQLVSAREEERRRLRRDLHDGIGPTLAGIAQQLDTARRLAARDPAAAEALLIDLKAQVKTSITDIRRLVYALRPPVLDELGLVSALREHAAPFNEADGMHVMIAAPADLPPLPAAVEVAAYRIAVEALTNATRHANARICTVRIALKSSGVLRLEIADDGCGLPAHTHAGVGITAMHERAAEVGGTLRIMARAEGGTCVHVRLPLAH